LFSQKIIKNIFFAILTALAFASTPAINRLAGYIKTEFILIFFICFSLYYLFLFFQTSEKKHLFYSAIFSAIANNVKYHGLIHSLIFIAILMFLFASKKIKIKTAVCAVFLLLLLSSPFYIKNYLDIGNPFYPFLCKYFNIKNIVSDEKNETQYIQEKSASMVRHFSEKKITGSPVISAIKFPYIVSIKFQTYDFWKYALSPLFFVFLCYIIIAVILKKETYCFYIFTFYIFAFIYLIYFNAPRARYVLPIYPIICVFGIYAFNSFMAQYPKLFRANIIIFFFIILINYPLLAAQHFTRYKVLFGFETKNEYLAKRMYSDGEFYQAIQWCNANLKNTDLLFVTHQLSFYFDIPVILGYTPNLTLSPINNINVYNELDFLEKLKKNNVSHIFYSHKFAVRFSYDIVEHIEKLQRQNYLIPLKEFNNNTIYLINYK